MSHLPLPEYIPASLAEQKAQASDSERLLDGRAVPPRRLRDAIRACLVTEKNRDGKGSVFYLSKDGIQELAG